MASEMIERVAEALYRRNLGERAREWRDVPLAQQRHYRAHAQSAIEAMREPTEGMCEAALKEGTVRAEDGAGYSIWTAMIDAALQKKPSAPSERQAYLERVAERMMDRPVDVSPIIRGGLRESGPA